MDHDGSTERARELIQRLSGGSPEAEPGTLANDLVREFKRGYSVLNLRALLSSPDDAVVETATWVASELGQQARPLLADLVPLLHHPVKTVRFFALDALLASTTGRDRDELGQVVPLIDDPEAAVRWKSLGFLARASSEQLHAALESLRLHAPDSVHTTGLAWLLSAEARNAAHVELYVHHSDAHLRKYGVVAAARLVTMDRSPLAQAASSDDADVAQFARDMLRQA